MKKKNKEKKKQKKPTTATGGIKEEPKVQGLFLLGFI